MYFLSMINQPNYNITLFDSFETLKLCFNEHNIDYFPFDQFLWLPTALYGIGFTTSIILCHWIFSIGILCTKPKISCKESKYMSFEPHTNSKKNIQPVQRPALKRRLTSIGRFAHRSETEENPSVIAFFVSIANIKGNELTINEFEDNWNKRVMKKHERFRSCISKSDDRFFENATENFYDYATQVQHPKLHHIEFQQRLQKIVSKPIDVTQKLWEVELSTGVRGSSGAIPEDLVSRIDPLLNEESIAVFRVHHSLGDGVSMSVAIGDFSDEAEELRNTILNEMNKRKKKHAEKNIFQKMVFYTQMALFYVLGSIKALSLQFYRMMTSSNPFDSIIKKSKIAPGERSVTWKSAAPVEEMKRVAKSIGRHITINDVVVSCTTAAIARQLEEHKNSLKDEFRLPSTVNVCIPVHLNGGVIPPGKSLGNKVGAFVTKVPACKNTSSPKRLVDVSFALREGKTTPAPLIAFSIAKFFSDYTPKSIAKFAMRNGNAKSVAVISNVHGFPFRVHWNGRPVQFLSAFLPLPPGIPIGIVAQSYAGDMSFTVNADMRAVPNADKFASWMMEEYERLKKGVQI